MRAHRAEFFTEPSIYTYGGSIPTYPTALSPRKLNWFACCRGSDTNVRGGALTIIPRNLALRAIPNSCGSTKLLDGVMESLLKSHPAVWGHS